MSIHLALTQSFFGQISQYFSLLSSKQAGQAACHCLTVNIPPSRGDAKDRTRGLIYAKHVLSHWTTSQICPISSFILISWVSILLLVLSMEGLLFTTAL